jgi:hypothetical protein
LEAVERSVSGVVLEQALMVRQNTHHVRMMFYRGFTVQAVRTNGAVRGGNSVAIPNL